MDIPVVKLVCPNCGALTSTEEAESAILETYYDKTFDSEVTVYKTVCPKCDFSFKTRILE